jgi:hypothetical protein
MSAAFEAALGRLGLIELNDLANIANVNWPKRANAMRSREAVCHSIEADIKVSRPRRNAPPAPGAELFLWAAIDALGACASGDELVLLGFRVGNPSAIGWHQPRIFQHPCWPARTIRGRGAVPSDGRRASCPEMMVKTNMARKGRMSAQNTHRPSIQLIELWGSVESKPSSKSASSPACVVMAP